MWRSSCILIKQNLSSAVRCGRKPPLGLRGCWQTIQDCGRLSTISSSVLSKAAGSSTTSVSSKETDADSGNSNSGGGGIGGGGGGGGGGGMVGEGDTNAISFAEAKRLMRLVNVEALKMKLGMEGKEVIGYSELLEACESMGVARSLDEAAAFARVLDEAGVVLLFRDKVYLHPDKLPCYLLSSLHCDSPTHSAGLARRMLNLQ